MMCKRNVFNFLNSYNRKMWFIRFITPDQSGMKINADMTAPPARFRLKEVFATRIVARTETIFWYASEMDRRRYFYCEIAIFLAWAAAPVFGGGVFENESREPETCPGNQCEIRPQDQVWKISTRHLGPCGHDCTSKSPDLAYQRFIPGKGWVCSNESEFFANDDSNRTTVAYVHGNRMTSEWALDHGFKVYCMLSRVHQSGGCDCQACGQCDTRHPGPMRFVVWSWPSEPIPRQCRVIKDARVKATRTAMQSNYLGWWLSRLHPNQNVGLIGYSYGARTILGGLHMLAGGSLDGRTLPAARYGNTVTPKIVLWATACQADWIVPGNRYGCATSKLSQALITFNRWDPVLRRYVRTLPESTGPALGSVGVVGACRIPAACRINVLNVQREVGRRHEFLRYVNSVDIATQSQRIALWQ